MMKDDIRVQKVITWRMENQRLDEQWLLAATMKEERVSQCSKEREKFQGIRMVQHDKVEPMDWLEEDIILGD